jgi:integrase
VWASAAYAGPRRGELRALRWSNVVGLDDDATGRRIEVEHS